MLVCPPFRLVVEGHQKETNDFGGFLISTHTHAHIFFWVCVLFFHVCVSFFFGGGVPLF